MALVLRRFDLQSNIRKRNPVVKRDPTYSIYKSVATEMPAYLVRYFGMDKLNNTMLTVLIPLYLR
jgi:hypothetical protein